MDDGDKPKLNLRSSSDSEDDSGVSFPDSPEATEPPSQSSTIYESSFSHSRARNSPRVRHMPAAGNVLRGRGKRRKEDIGEIWDDLKERQIRDDEKVISGEDIGKAVGKAKVAVSTVSKNILKGYKDAVSESQSTRQETIRRIQEMENGII